MNVLKFVNSIFLCLALGACAQKAWVKKDGSHAEFETAKYECQRAARQSRGFGTRLSGALNRQEFYDACMNSHGYTYEVRDQADAQISAARTSLAAAEVDFVDCKKKLRVISQYRDIISYLPDDSTGRFSFKQMVLNNYPSKQETELLSRYFADYQVCVAAFDRQAEADISNRSRMIILRRQSEREADAASLIRGRISYGDWATQENKADQQVASMLHKD